MQSNENAAWYVAKTSGRDTRALLYVRRNGVAAFWPERHSYFIDRRTKVEKFRVSGQFPGYLFFQLNHASDLSRVTSAIGVAYVLGEVLCGQFRPARMPAGMVERLIEAGPLIEGKRKKFCNGDSVRVIIDELTTVISRVERHRNGKVHLQMEMLGAKRIVVVDEKRVEAA